MNPQTTSQRRTYCCHITGGILALKNVRGAVDADVYYTFVCKYLLPKLMPLYGQSEHCVVVQDNCAIHHVQEVTDVLHDASVIVQYLPPYSPDYNPIEECFSKVKFMLKAMEVEMEFYDDIDTIIPGASPQLHDKIALDG